MTTATEIIKEAEGFLLDADVDLDQIFLDETYGREPSRKRLEKLIANWDRDKVGVLMVSLRNDGRYASVDGWHRVLAGREAGEEHLPARVYLDIGVAREAELYVAFNADRLRPAANDNFKGRLRAADTTALLIDAAVRSAGLSINLGRREGGGIIRSVTSLERSYAALGDHLFAELLHVLYSAWGREQSAYQSPMITALMSFLKRYGDHEHYSSSRLIDVLKESGVHVLLRAGAAARESIVKTDTLGLAVGQVIWAHYNRLLRSRRLPDWQGTKYGKAALESASSRMSRSWVTRRKVRPG